MKISYRQYPHPVLTPFSNDFVSSKFEIEIETEIVELPEGKIKFLIDGELTNEELKDLIKNDKAVYALHFECSSTRFRKLFSFSQKDLEQESLVFEIFTDKLDGKVEICPLILAVKDLTDYKNSDFHPDYGSASFEIEKGDILAVSEQENAYVDKEIDSLQDVSSMFRIRVNKDNNAPPFDVEAVGRDKVFIKLSQENYDCYTTLEQNSELSTILNSELIIPTLVFLLELIKNGDRVYLESYRWFHVLDTRLEKIGIDIDNLDSLGSTVSIAQKVVGNPLNSSFEKLLKEYGYQE